MRKGFFLLLLQFGCISVQAQITRTYTVILRSNSQSANMWDGTVLPMFGFATLLSEKPPLPAKTLYANEGDTVIIKARMISQGHHHTIHLHGLDVDTRNDGDPATSFQLGHMQDTTYTFFAKHAGTYIYHCHVGDVVHVQMGMYGLIVVRAAGGAKTAWTGGPPFHKEYNWLTSEIDKAWHLNVPVHDTINNIMNIPPYRPDYFLISGKSETELGLDDSTRITALQGEVVYLRLANIGFYDNRIIFPAALNPKIIDSDGRPLPVENVIDTLIISPGERYGVLLQASSQFTDSIPVEYINMNTYQIASTQNVPVTISGYIGVNKEKKENAPFLVFPNPASGMLQIISEGTFISEVRIYNCIGQLVHLENPMREGEVQLDVEHLAHGLYSVALISNGNALFQKLIILK